MAATELSNATGMKVLLVDRGAAIRAIRVPAADGIVDTGLEYSDPDGYATDPYCFGATPGRYAGRIRGGQLSQTFVFSPKIEY